MDLHKFYQKRHEPSVENRKFFQELENFQFSPQTLESFHLKPKTFSFRSFFPFLTAETHFA